MIQEPELEEGEACYYSIDPDIALSYIDDKVQSILGHYQKDFEGEVSAENLGAKFGGYGSFLPIYQRSPVRSQPKSPQRIQNPHLPKSPNHAWPKNNDPPSPSVHASKAWKNSFNDAASRQNADTVSEEFLGKVNLPVSNSANQLDQKSLKVRLKVGADKLAQYNAEIYNLGLTSPSSSEDNSPIESDELLLESHDIPDESPADIFQIMASFRASGALLLSPLNEDLLKLESMCQAAPQSSAISAMLSKSGVSNEKRAKWFDERKEIEKSEGQFTVDLNTKQKILGSGNFENTRQTFHDFCAKPLEKTAGESGKDVPVKKIKKSKDRVKGRAVSDDLVEDNSLEHASGQQPESRCSSMNKVEKHPARIAQKDISVNHGHGSMTDSSRNCASVNDFLYNSEVEEVKGAVDGSHLRSRLTGTSSKHHGVGLPHAVNMLSSRGESKPKGSQSSGWLASEADSFRSRDYAAPEHKHSGKKDVSSLRLSLKDVVTTSSIDLDKPNHLLERSSNDKLRNYTLGAAKSKSACSDKLKEKTKNKENLDKVISDMHVEEPPNAALHINEGTFSGLEPMAVGPVIIEENWVGCDHCEKWRLLPYGITSEQLPEKWVCSMLNWLPGMNNCDISEDDTTKALRALYLVPVPENQHNCPTYVDGTTTGVVSAGVHKFWHNNKNNAYDQMKKQKRKEKQNTASRKNSVPSNGEKHLLRLAMKTGDSKEVKPSFTGVSATNKSAMRQPNRSAIVVEKSNKRKGEFLLGDGTNQREKIQKKSAQDVKENGEKIKSQDVCALDNLQTSCLKSGLLDKAARNDWTKNRAQQDAFSRGVGNIQIHIKKQKDQMQDLPDDGVLGMKSCNSSEEIKKRIKLKDYAASQHREETRLNNGNDIQDRKVVIKEDSEGLYFCGDKKAQMSLTEEEFRRSESDALFKRKHADPKERVTEPRAKHFLTIDDINKVRKDLGCDELSRAVTTSCSKVSDPLKNRISYMEVKASPEVSVSSHPTRMIGPNQASPMMMETVGKVDSKYNGVGSVKKFQDNKESSELTMVKKRTSDLTNGNGSEILDSRSKFKGETDADDSYHAPEHRGSRYKRHSLSDTSSVKSVKNSADIGKGGGKSSDRRSENQPALREHVKNDQKSSHPCSTEMMHQNRNDDFLRSSVWKMCTKKEPWNGKLRIDLRQGNKQSALCPMKHASGSLRSSKIYMDSRPPLDTSLAADTSKPLKDIEKDCIGNQTNNLIKNDAEGPVAVEASHGNDNISGVTACTALKEAEDVLKEAEELRNHADLIKNSGFGSESNHEYFKAALKFLHGASLLEACNEGSNKHWEITPMQMYYAAAKLCKTCACEYEKDREMAAAAALAYKCVEVACLRVVYCKSSTMSRVWHDLQSSLQMVPQGGSPSSSASDVDNLNNVETTDKVTLSEGSGSHVGNYVILPRNCPDIVRLLDFAKDVDSAMEAAKKSQDTFSAAHLELKESKNKEAIVSIKRVLDSSFQNIKELMRLTWLSFNSIKHQNPGSHKE